MKIDCKFTAKGDLKIPSYVVKKIGIKNTDDLKLIYDEETNEVELTRLRDKLSIPDDMLEEAGIPVDSNLIAFCRNGEIVIKQDDEELESNDSTPKIIDTNYVPEYVKVMIATLEENPDIKILKLNLK